MIRYLCAGPVIGTWSKEEAAALKRPALAGKRKRGVRVRKMRAGETVVEIPRRCGNDLTALTAAVPDDGLDHAIKCPKCGTVARVRRHPDDA